MKFSVKLATGSKGCHYVNWISAEDELECHWIEEVGMSVSMFDARLIDDEIIQCFVFSSLSKYRRDTQSIVFSFVN